MRRAALPLALALLLVLLCGCGSIFAGDYYHETDYSLPEPQPITAAGDRVTVGDYEALKQALLDMAYAGQTQRRIVFDSEYPGDARADLDTACGTMHRQDALWAYCVQNARFEVSRIVAHDEAELTVEYAASALPVEEILQINYAAGLERILRTAMENDSRRLVILIRASTYSADAMAELVRRVYRSDPACAAAEPTVDVYMYSGLGRQRLYDIELDYRLEDEELQSRRAALESFDSAALLGEDRSPGMRALDLARGLYEHCLLSERSGRNTPWDALIAGQADSEGLALAYVQLCRQQNIACQIVYGQRDWQDHCWNIIELGGQHYHVDLSACIEEGPDKGFLLNDAAMWERYRWDVSSYAICAGELDYWALTGLSPEEEEPPETPPGEEPPPPAETEAPEESPEPTETPEPEETPRPTESPEPTEPPPAETEEPTGESPEPAEESPEP